MGRGMWQEQIDFVNERPYRAFTKDALGVGSRFKLILEYIDYINVYNS
jgi:hypothetical protein